MQGPAAGFIIVLLSVKNTDNWQCKQPSDNNTENGILSQNERLQQLAGSIMVGSLFEIIIGGTGLVGLLLRFIGPITVGPTIALIGIGLFKIPIGYSFASWELSILGSTLVLVFSLYLGHIKLPFPSFKNCKRICKKDEKVRGIRIFRIFPVLLSIVTVWGLSAILTYTNVFPNDPESPRYKARTDANVKLVERAPWFYLPYPGQFGTPSFNVGIFIGFIAVYIASLIESVGDYVSAGKVSQVEVPPDHAVNRGIMLEGIGGLISGAFGIGHATTSYTQNIAAMTHTRTANRYVLVCAGAIMMIIAVVGKFGAALSTIPPPVLAGVYAITCGMLVAMGLSTLQHVNLKSSRNLLIIGTSIFFGVFISQWIDRYPAFFKTGNGDFDNILLVILGTPMFVGGFIAFILDNTTRGSREDRGIDAWRGTRPSSVTVDDQDNTYSCLCQTLLDRLTPWVSKLPFMPPLKTPAVHEARNDAHYQSRL